MNNTLNTLKNLSARASGPSTCRARVPRVAFGLAGIAMTAITLAAAVILPAQLDSGKREQRLLLASQATRPASNDDGSIMSITVVAAREPRSPTASLQTVEAARQSGETTSSAILRISSAAQ